MNPPRAGSIPVVRPSKNGPFVTETQDKPRKLFSASHLEAFKRIQAIGIRLNIESIDSRRLLAESTNGMADHSLYEVFKTSP